TACTHCGGHCFKPDSAIAGKRTVLSIRGSLAVKQEVIRSLISGALLNRARPSFSCVVEDVEKLPEPSESLKKEAKSLPHSEWCPATHQAAFRVSSSLVDERKDITSFAVNCPLSI